MADSSSEHIIRLIVQGVNRLGDLAGKVAKEQDRITGAQDRNTKSVKANEDAIADLRAEHARVVSEIKGGSKTYDDARFSLARLSSEFDKLARKQKLGSALAEDLNRSSLAAKRLAEQLKVAHETESRLAAEAARDRVRREEERQRLTQQTIDREVKEEQRGAAARKGLVEEILGEVRRDHEERKRFARDLTDFEIKEAIRVEDERARSRASRRQGELVEQRQGVIQRVRGFFGGGDQSGGIRRFTEDLSGMARGSDDAEKKVTRLDRTLEKLHGTTGRVGFSVAKVDNNLRGLAVVGAIAFSQQLISALVSLAGTMLAVASAAAQAGAAIGGAFVASVGQAVPTIGLLIAAFGRIGAVFDAVKLFNNQATRSGRDQAAAADAQAAAADRVVSSQEQVASATQRVRDATDALTEARRKAIENIQDLNLAERAASSGGFQAEQALRRAISSGDVGALEGLRVQRDQARLTSSRASRDAAQARTQGVSGSDQVKQAVQTLEDANIALGRANREMAAAQRAATRAASGTSAADEALKEALGQLSKAELGLYESVKRIQATFKRLFRPITDIIVTAFSGAVDRVRVVMADPRILGPLRQIAEAIAGSIRRITAELTSSRSLDFFKFMATEAAKNIPLLTTIGIKVNRIFSAIARAASPALRKFLEFLDEIVTKGDKATNSKSGVARLQRFFLRGEEMAESFARLAGAVIRLFAALAGAGGADTGQSAIDQLITQINKATDWVNENQDKVRKFFSDSLDAAKAIASAIFAIGRAVAKVFNSDKVRDFTDAFKDVLLPALTDTILVLGGITDLFLKFLDLPVVRDVAKFALSLGLISKAFNTIGKLLIPLSGGIAKLLGDLPLLGRAFRALAVGIRFSAAILSGPWGIAIAAVILAIVALDRKFHFLGPTIKFIGGVFKDVFKGIEKIVLGFVDVWLGMVTTVLGGISSLASAASHLPIVGSKFKGVADFIDKAREKIDGWRESIRGLGDEHDKTSTTITRLKKEVEALQGKLAGLDKGSAEYRITARKLHVAQGNLNVAMREAEADGKAGAKGPRAIGRSAASAADAVDSANKSIADGFNSLAKQLGGIKEIKYTTSGITARGNKSSITSDSGDILAGTSPRAMGGWVGGQAGGTQGPDDIIVRAGRGEAFVNVEQQGPVEEGLSLRSLFFGGPSSLMDLFRQTGGAMFARGGFVGGVDLKGAAQAMLRYARDAATYGLSVSSGLRTGSITSSGNLSNHAIGRAIDLVGSAGDMLRYATHAARAYGRRLAELIHTPLGYGIKGGRRVPLSFWGARVNADHVGHVHVADTGSTDAGGIGGGTIARQRIRGPAGALHDVAQRAVDRIRRVANDRLDRLAGATDAESARSVAGRPANSAQIRGWIAAGLRLAQQRVTPSAVSTLFGRIMQESGGDPDAVNRTDVNARRGDPSRGILQVIGSTFRQFMVRGHGNVLNPVDNIAAAVRYMLARYGHLVGRGPGGYASGGFVGGKSTGSTGATYRVPAVFNTSVRGIIAELRNAQAAIRSIQTRAPTFVRDFARSISQITDDGGLLDQGRDAIQRVVDQMALRLRQAVFSVTRSGLVVRRLTPEQQDVAAISSLDRQRESLQSLRGVAAGSLRDVERRLAAIQKGGVSTRERTAYETLVTARRSLVAKIGDLDVAIADAIEARFNAQEQVLQDAIDSVNAKAQRVASRADLFDRVATLVEGAGASQAAFQIRGADLQARASAMITQRDSLARLAGVAQAQGNTKLVTDLIGQIEELNVSLLENAAAVRSNTVQARQASIDAITNRGTFLGGVTGGLTSIVQTLGTITGALDVPELRSLGERASTTLSQTGQMLRGQLLQGFGINLGDAHGQDFVNLLNSLDFDHIEASFSVEQRAQFEGLINAIISNEGELQTNTQQLRELSQTVEQSFSSTAWQLFRQAIFDGSGGLLPRFQFQIPAMASGGTVMSDGLVFAHSGEPILPARVSRSMPDWGGGDTTNINITPVTGEVDPGHIADVLSFRKSLRRAT